MSVRALVVLAMSVAGLNAKAMVYDVEKVTNQNGHTLNVVRMAGLIGSVEMRRWVAITSELDPTLDTLFVLDSPGGNIANGFMMIKRVDEFIAIQDANHRKTWIALEGQCASMCVPVYFAWPNRFAVINTQIGLHGASDGTFGRDEDLTESYLQTMLEHAEARNESKSVNWIHQMVSQGDFWTNKITAHPVQDLAKDGGLLPAAGIVDSVQSLIDQLD